MSSRGLQLAWHDLHYSLPSAHGVRGRGGRKCLSDMSGKIRTSTSSPIRVDFLPVHAVGLPGRIGMTLAPGKKGHGATGHWERDLSTDLERLYHVYSTVILVTLLEPHERELLHIGSLLEAAAAARLEVLESRSRMGACQAHMKRWRH